MAAGARDRMRAAVCSATRQCARRRLSSTAVRARRRDTTPGEEQDGAEAPSPAAPAAAASRASGGGDADARASMVEQWRRSAHRFVNAIPPEYADPRLALRRAGELYFVSKEEYGKAAETVVCVLWRDRLTGRLPSQSVSL